MSIDDVNNYAVNNNIYLSNQELVFTYNFIKDNYLYILNDINSFDFSKYKTNYTDVNYNKINELIIKYKKYVI